MKKNYIYIVLLLTFSFGCLTKIDFGAGSSSTIVSGVITNNEDARNILVSRSNGIHPEHELLEASGVVYKNGELNAELIQKEPGVLTVPSSFEVEEGATYYIEIRTKDNQVYQSSPQTVPFQRVTDSLSFQIVQKEIGVSATGEIIDKYYVEFYAHINIPDQKDTLYYKWQTDASWNMVSFRRTCYKTRNVRERPLTLFNSKKVPPGKRVIKIATEELDEAFWYKHYFNAYLHMIDRQSYEFYERVQRLTENTGNLYDEVPGPFRGNVFLQSGDKETVLGNIEFSLASLLRLPVDSFMINEQIDFFRPCEDGFSFRVLCVCEDCIGWVPAESWDEKPDYFVD